MLTLTDINNISHSPSIRCCNEDDSQKPNHQYEIDIASNVYNCDQQDTWNHLSYKNRTDF